MPDTPITTEPTSAVLSALIALSRHFITAFGAVAIAKGWLDQGTLNAIIALLAATVPAAVTVYSSYQKNKALKAAAPLVSNAIIGSK